MGSDEGRAASRGRSDEHLDKMTSGELAAYRPALGARLRRTRIAHGWSVGEVASRIGITAAVLDFYENGQRQPSLRRLMRLCSVYHLDVFDLLVPVAAQIRRAAGRQEDTAIGTPRLESAFQALMMFCGVLPEEVRPLDDRSTDRSAHAELQNDPGAVQEIREMSGAEASAEVSGELRAPLGELLRYRREDDPIRMQGGWQLRKEYESGASIRELSIRHKMAFGTVRTLLLEVGTPLRGPGGSHSGPETSGSEQ